MQEDVPVQYKTAAIAQIVSGVVNMLLMAAVISVTLSGVFGTIGLTCGTILLSAACPAGCIGWLMPACGLWGLVLLPIGFAEVMAGVYALTEPRKGAPFVRGVAVLELVSVLFGGLPSAVVGGCVLMLLGDPKVALYLVDDGAEGGASDGGTR